MLTYAETTRSSTIVPLAPVPQGQRQQDTAHYVSSAFSYAIGPIDPAQLTTMHAHLSDGEECTLLMPSRLPSSILNDPAFGDGYEWNYATEEEGGEEEEWTTIVTRLVNHVYTSLTDDRFYRDLDTGKVRPDFLLRQVGWLLRVVTRLAETDRTLALVGIAHLCFLLPLLTQERPSDWPRYEPYHARILHDRAVKAYRGRIRGYREQGKSFDEAQRLALC